MTTASQRRSLRASATGTTLSGHGLIRFLKLEQDYLNERDRLAISARLKESRIQAGLTELEIAELLDPPVRDRTIRNYESGRVPFKYLRQWAEITQTGYDWILRGEPDLGQDSSAEARLDRIEQALEQLVARLEQAAQPDPPDLSV